MNTISDIRTYLISKLKADDGLSDERKRELARYEFIDDDHRVEQLNREVRKIDTDWVAGQIGWPEDEWIIGENGAGDYYTVSKARKYYGLKHYDHEFRVFEIYAYTPAEFYADITEMLRDKNV